MTFFAKTFDFVNWLISRPPSWAHRRNMDAWCDGALINGSPWHCLCCTRLTNRLRGIKRKTFMRECNTRNLGHCSFEMVINKHHVVYAWPQVKWVYPDVDGWKY